MLDILRKPIEQLGLSAAFCEDARSMGFGSLEDILAISPAELVKKSDFSYGWLAELSSYLSARGMLHLLQTIPGRSFD